MMPAAEGHGELVAGFSAKRPALGKAQVVGASPSSPWPANSSPFSMPSCETNTHGSQKPLDR